MVWVTSNVMVCIAMAATALISFWSLKDYHGYVQDAITASPSIKAVCLVLFAFLGVPLAVSFSPPIEYVPRSNIGADNVMASVRTNRADPVQRPVRRDGAAGGNQRRRPRALHRRPEHLHCHPSGQ
jgi:hypothetical protein